MSPLRLPSLLSPQAVVKALEQLTQQGKIKEKVHGKQKVYFPDQVSQPQHPPPPLGISLSLSLWGSLYFSR